jgi:hypothetical protein
MASIIDIATIAKWLVNNLTQTKISMFVNFILKQGKQYWMSFKSWFWGLNCDNHEALVRNLLPIMPVTEDAFDKLAARVEQVSDALIFDKFEECIEMDMSCNEEFNQDLVVKKEGEEDTFNRKAGVKQRHRIKDGKLSHACKAIELQLRTKHGLVPGNELNEAALRMTALETCKMYNMNDIDTYYLCRKPVMMAMIPDQMQMDAIRCIYNGETSARRATAEALRASESYAHFTSGHYA